MRKLLITLGILFGVVLNNYGQKISALPAGSSIAAGDQFVYVQGGTTKSLLFSVIADKPIGDTADVLRAEFPPLWRTDIADTATVLRSEIATAVTADTAWTYSGNYVYLKHINDSVGVGTITPDTKFEVNGVIKASSLLLNNYGTDENINIGNSAGASLSAGGAYNINIGEF